MLVYQQIILCDQIISQSCNQFLKEIGILNKEISRIKKIPFYNFKKYNFIQKWIVGGSLLEIDLSDKGNFQ